MSKAKAGKQYVITDCLVPPRVLDEKGRCCGRKPIVYKREKYQFCPRCDRAYDMDGKQIRNWAWAEEGEGFRSRIPWNPD